MEKDENTLILIPKCEDYMGYMLDIILKLPRIEKFNTGNEYKNSMYRLLSGILYINKSNIQSKIEHLNEIDVELEYQRILLRVMKKYGLIDVKKFNVSITKISEMGKITGGLLKFYAKNIKK
ncbi:MAG: four helix bundle protein [Clostridia bacterium]|nr:four helix bundle protein [Clostridia bacterium]